MAVSDWSVSASLNTAVGGKNIAPGMARADVDDAIRAIMAEAKGGFAVSIGAFSATGDGVTDDTAQLQTALDSGAGVVTLVQGKTYKTTSVLTVPTGVFIEATGATISATHNGKAIAFTSGGGIRGGVINGPGGATYVSGSIGIDCRGTSNTPAAPTYVTGPMIVGTEVKNFGEYGIRLQYVQKGVIDAPNVHDCAYAGIAGLSCEDVSVRSPRVVDITPGSPADAYGIFFDRQESGASETSDPRSYRITILDPDIQRVSATGGNGEGIDSHGGVDIQVIGGTVIDCQKGVVFTRSTVGGTAALAPLRCKVIGTNIRNASHAGSGVVVSGAINAGTVVQYAEDCAVVGVTVDGHGVDATSGTGGYFFQATHRLCVSGASASINARAGFYYGLANIAFNHTGGVITDPHDTTYTAPSCIQFGNNDNSGFIGGVTFRYESAAHATYVAVNAIRVDGSLTGLALDFGTCAKVGLDGSHLLTTLSTTTGVRQRGFAEPAAANPDTSGAALATLETEVNELKAALRTAGLIAS